MAARYGGEEFVVILPNTDLPSATTWAERMRKRIARSLQTPDGTHVTISLGVAGLEFADETPPEGTTPLSFEAFFKRADQMLYEAKNGGRNRVASTRITDDIEQTQFLLQRIKRINNSWQTTVAWSIQVTADAL